MSLYIISPFVCAIIALVLGVFVFSKNFSSPINRAFTLLCFETFWWQACWFATYFLKTTAQLDICAKVAYSSILFLPFTYFHFVVQFLNLKKKMVWVRSFYLIGFFWLIILWSTDFFISGYHHFNWGYYARARLLHPIYLAFAMLAIARLLILLRVSIRDHKHSAIARNQSRFIFLAASLFAFAAIEYLINYGIGFYPVGVFFILGSFSVIAYAIIKYRLMDITAFAVRGAIFSIVYALVLGIPFGIMIWLRPFIEGFGYYGMLIPLLPGMSLASAGPFIYLFIKRRAEELVFKERRRYQEILNNLSKSMIDIRDIEKLFTTLTLTIVDAVKINFAAIYLREEDYKSFQLKNCYPKEVKSKFQELIPLDNPHIDILNQRKKPILSEELGYQEKINFDPGLVIPLFGKDGLIGFIILGAKQNNQMYTNDDLLVFENLSYNTSLAIENCTYWKEIEEHQRQSRVQEMNLFSYSLAHEIDNPMAIIIGHADLLKKYFVKENLSEEKQQEVTTALDYILEAAHRVSDMVDAIQDLGRKTISEFNPVKLEEVLTSFCKLYEPIFKNEATYFTKELPENLPILRGVKEELMQLLVIFSNNALHALLGTQEKEKRIHLKIEIVNSDWIRLSLTDNGYGITKEKIHTIFAPFVTTKASSEGTGFGLYNAKKIVDRHKGRIWAESEGEGKGATFLVELPIAKDININELKEKPLKGKMLFGFEDGGKDAK